MAKPTVTPSGRESPFGEHELIVTKTDLKGRITYANDVFLRVSHLTLKGALGQPHSIIRHPEMPRAIFKLLWDTIEARREIFAYVVNLASNGDHYWVFAHVTPSFDAKGSLVGYHSNRRKPKPEQIARIAPVYRDLLKEEQQPENRKDGLLRATDLLNAMLRERGIAYDEFVFAV
jgi:PAS domain S-box-containing protein